MGRFADVEALAVAYLTPTLGVRVTTDIPSNLEQVVPLVRVIRGPGTDDGHNDNPLLDVEVFTAATADRAGLWDLSEQVRDALTALAGNAVDGRLVDTVTTASAPSRVAYGNPAVQRTVASYRLTLRAR